MRRGRSSKLAIVAGATLLVVPAPAFACTIVTPIKITLDGPPPSYRDECRTVWRGREDFLEDIASGAKSYWDYAHIANAFREGENGCRKRPAFALALVDAAIGSPVLSATNPAPTDQFLAWKDETVPQQRVEEVRVGAWLFRSSRADRGGWNCSPWPYYEDTVPSDVSLDTLREYITDAQHWPRVIEQFGNNPGRDRLVLRELINPSSKRFDVQLAGELAPKFYHGHRPEGFLPILVDVAEAVADPRLGDPDYEAAARILEMYSPYAPNSFGEEANAKAQALWVRIAQTRLSHPNLQMRRDALVALQTGNPQARATASFEDVLGQGVKVRVLKSWPADLPPLRNLDRAAARITQLYPGRALRALRGGRVELGVLFGPDGSFHSVHVVRSAGKDLDRAASRGAIRYLRPKLPQMTISGFEGHHVYVPLPSFEYWMSGAPGAEAGEVEAGFDGETITIVGKLR